MNKIMPQLVGSYVYVFIRHLLQFAKDPVPVALG